MSDRSIKTLFNIKQLLLFRVISMIAGFLLVRVTLNFVSVQHYGLWIAISSMIGWFSLLDFGVGNGLKNKFAEAKSLGNLKLIKIYVSSAYFTMLIALLLLGLSIFVFHQKIKWTKIFNAPESLNEEVSTVCLIVCTYVCIRLGLAIISTLLIANQESGKAGLIDALSNVIVLVIVYVLGYFKHGTLLSLSIVSCIVPLAVLLIATILIFNNQFKEFKPNWRYIRYEEARSLLGIGLIFFLIQISIIVQFQLTNVLISNFFGPEHVVGYNVAFKYFSLISVFFGICITPFWSAVTDAYYKEDFQWIIKAVGKYQRMWLKFVLVGLGMFFFAESFYNLWLGKDKVTIPWTLSLICLISALTSSLSSIFIYPLNGISVMRIQLIASLISPVIFIVLVNVFVSHLSFGAASIVLATILSNVWGNILAPIQYRKVFVDRKTTGIWKW